MLRDTRTPIDGSSIVHADLQGLNSDDHKQYVLTIGGDRAVLDVENPSAGEILEYDSTAGVWFNTVNSGGSGTSGTSGVSGTSGSSGTSGISGGQYLYLTDATSSIAG